MDISRFIKESRNLYSDTLGIQVEKIGELVEKNVISPKFGVLIINYLMRREVSDLIKHNIGNILQQDKKDQWLLVKYDRKQTNYV